MSGEMLKNLSMHFLKYPAFFRKLILAVLRWIFCQITFTNIVCIMWNSSMNFRPKPFNFLLLRGRTWYLNCTTITITSVHNLHYQQTDQNTYSTRSVFFFVLNNQLGWCLMFMHTCFLSFKITPNTNVINSFKQRKRHAPVYLYLTHFSFSCCTRQLFSSHCCAGACEWKF